LASICRGAAVTEWVFAANAIATNLIIGNSLAGAIGADVGDNLTFTNGKPLRLIGSQETTPVAWFAHVPLKETGYDRISEFNTAGPYPLLNSLGLSDQTIAAGKDAVTAEVGERHAIEERWLTFIQEQGYEVIP
jgi:hypothetical protein